MGDKLEATIDFLHFDSFLRMLLEVKQVNQSFETCSNHQAFRCEVKLGRRRKKR